MSLGGNYYQMTLVKEAKRMGVRVIDVDYLPDNPAHRYADKYYDISIVDKERVLQVAKMEEIDGIISYASDVGALTAAYVAQDMGLPTNSYQTVELMTRKDLFHPFLEKKGFVVPRVSVLKDANDAKFFLEEYGKIVVKPVNSSGSKGISIIESVDCIEEAWRYATEFSNGGNIIAEEYYEREGYQVSGDIFVVDGKVRNWGLANAHRDKLCNPLVPIGDSFPLSMEGERIDIIKNEIQRAITCLGFENGPVNVEFAFDKKNRPVIVELGPRSGGGLLADIIYMGSDVNILAYCVKAALGMDLSDIQDRKFDRYLSAYSFHSDRDGIFDSINIAPQLQGHILMKDYFVEPGDRVYKCNDSGKAVGIAICEFDNETEMLRMMDGMNDYYEILFR